MGKKASKFDQEGESDDNVKRVKRKTFCSAFFQPNVTRQSHIEFLI